LFVAEGVRTVEALLASSLGTTGLLHSPALLEDGRGRALLEGAQAIGVPITEISDADLTTAADTETPQGVLAIAAIPRHQLPAPAPGYRLLVLDALQDPGNVGTIVRTAAAMGVTATVSMPGTVDFWNAKVVRSSMGALFTHPVVQSSWEDLMRHLDEHDLPLWAADTAGTVLGPRLEVPAVLALAVGNEGAGLSAQVADRAALRVAIRMVPGVESLNVAVATGILLHALAPFTSVD
jgi:RNA methyltransferase, TrmH family